MNRAYKVALFDTLGVKVFSVCGFDMKTLGSKEMIRSKSWKLSTNKGSWSMCWLLSKIADDC